MSVSRNTQAILLLVARLGGRGEGEAKPLTPKEWGRFALWLKERSLEPWQLLSDEAAAPLNGWQDKAIPPARLEALLSRGAALALSMEKWERVGLWVLTRSDEDYPNRLKRRLGTDSPAVLFGCGNRKLLGGGGIAVVGSRNAPESAIDSAHRIGTLAAAQALSVVSGGARGVDEAARRGAFDAGGTAIEVLPDGLLRATTSGTYRRYLLDDSLVLVSPFNPEAGFNAGNAMARNKYIYCLSDAAIVVHSGTKGGTWSGATENAKHCWVPLWVLQSEATAAGNRELRRKTDARALSALDGLELAALTRMPARHSAQRDLAVREISDDYERPDIAETHEAEPAQLGSAARPGIPDEMTLYDLFLVRARRLCSDSAKRPEELSVKLALTRSQLNLWLKQAVADGALKKKTKPIRYATSDARDAQIAMFDRS